MSLLSVAGGIMLGAVFSLFLAIALVTESERDPVHLSSFYFEAHIEVPRSEDDDVLSRLRGWYETPDRWRYEFSSSDPARAHETVIQVSDGEHVWLYQGETNTYFVGGVEAYFSGMASGPDRIPPPPSFSLLIGPVPSGDLEAFIQTLTVSTNLTLDARRPGERIAGRATERIDIEGDPGQQTRLWVDRDRAFFLRFETPYGPGGGLLSATVDAVTFDEDIDDAVFAFEPPPDAREVESGSEGSSGASGSGGSVSVDPPDGYLAPAYVPDGYEAFEFEKSQNELGTTRYVVRYRKQAGTFTIDQHIRFGGLADSQRTGEPVDVGDRAGYLQRDGDELALIWANGDLVIRLTSSALDADDLLRIAESMRS